MTWFLLSKQWNQNKYCITWKNSISFTTQSLCSEPTIIVVVYKTTFKICILVKRHTGWRDCSKKPGTGGQQSSMYTVLHHDLQLLPGPKNMSCKLYPIPEESGQGPFFGLKDSKQGPETKVRFSLWLVWPSQSCLACAVSVTPVRSRLPVRSNPYSDILLPRSLQTKWDYWNSNSSSFEWLVPILHLESISYLFRL